MPIRSRREFLASVATGALSAAVAPHVWAQSRRRPNIVFFLVDDMGWMDSTVYGSRYYETPNMERLARESMRFTDAHTASPLCSPTRASLMSGKYPGRLGFTSAAGHQPPRPSDAPMYLRREGPASPYYLPETKRYLPPGEFTIAEALRAAGYATGHFGKWHMGLNEEHWPEQQGFDVSFHGAPDPGPRSYFSPYNFPKGTVTDGPEGEYIADRLTDEAIHFMKGNRDKPFFVNLWHYSVHGPWGHKKEYTERFMEKTDPRGKQKNPIMASMLESVDESLGRVLDAIDELALRDDTIVIFFSDNGGNAHSRTNRDERRGRRGRRDDPRIQDYRKYAGYEPPTNNEPLRGGKGNIYEGGTRVPFMVRWPGVVAPGSVCETTVSSVDFYPTMLEMTGAKAPSEQTLDGVSLGPLLRGKKEIGREAIFCYFPHLGTKGCWVRKGPWKLIRFFALTESQPNEFELYNLADDIGETRNLALEMPEKVRELNALIDAYLDETVAYPPQPNPDYDPIMRRLGAWQARKTDVAPVDGGMRFTGKGRGAHLNAHGFNRKGLSGPLRLRLRVRCPEAFDCPIRWTEGAEKTFSAERTPVTLSLQAQDDWRDVEIAVPATEPVTRLRLFLPLKTLDIARIRLTAEDGDDVASWDFSDGEPGGANAAN